MFVILNLKKCEKKISCFISNLACLSLILDKKKNRSLEIKINLQTHEDDGWIEKLNA